MKAAWPRTMIALDPTNQKKSAIGEANQRSGIPVIQTSWNDQNKEWKRRTKQTGKERDLAKHKQKSERKLLGSEQSIWQCSPFEPNRPINISHSNNMIHVLDARERWRNKAGTQKIIKSSIKELTNDKETCIERLLSDDMISNLHWFRRYRIARIGHLKNEEVSFNLNHLTQQQGQGLKFSVSVIDLENFKRKGGRTRMRQETINWPNLLIAAKPPTRKATAIKSQGEVRL